MNSCIVEGMRRYVLSHLPIAIIYALTISLWRGGFWPLSLDWATSQLWWVMGVVVGVMLVFLDRVVYVYSFPMEQISQQFEYLWKQKSYLRALSLLDSRRHEQIKLTFRSALFAAAWVPLAFFALTSTTGLFGKGVVMGLMLHILADSWRMHRKSPDLLNMRLFWQIRARIKVEEQVLFLVVISIIFGVFSLLIR
jgi:hypothetical protein